MDQGPILLQYGGFPGGAVVKEFVCQCRACGSSPWVGKIPGEENGNLLQYSCLENSIGAWRAVVFGVSKSQTWQQLSMHALLQ